MTTEPDAAQFLENGEGRVAYEVSGAGPLVVCLPGMGELRSLYRLTAPALAAAGFQVAAMDLRGHGDSDATFRSYDDVAASRDALALVEYLGGPAVLIGSSMGAGAAVWAAAERPEVVSGLVLIGPFVRDPPANSLSSAFFRVAMCGPWAPALWTAYLPKLYPGRRPTDFADHRLAIAASMRRPGHSRAFRQTTRTSHAAVEARLQEVVAPTLVVMGGRDPDFPDPEEEARFIAGLLDADVLVVPDAGHYPHVEYPEVVNPVIIDFVERVTDRG